MSHFSPSYWDHNTYFKDIDTCIIGAGITGLTAAMFLKQKHPHARILVLERSPIPYGASTRNAGFACFGSAGEIIDDLKHESEEQVFLRVEERHKGILRLRELLGDKSLKFEQHGGYEIFSEKNNAQYTDCLDKLPYLNRCLRSIFKEDVFRICNEKISEFGFAGVTNMIRHSEEGQLDTGEMMKALLSKVQSLGVSVLNGIEVKHLEDDGLKCELTTNDAHRFHTRAVIIAVNGFASRLLPNLDLQPARSQVLVTSPVENLPFKGTFHYDRGYTYLRNVGNRIMIGGGRNLDFENEMTDQIVVTQKIQDYLTGFIKEHILPGMQFSPEYSWSGIMGVGSTKSPIVEKSGQNIYCAVRLGGMGVAIGAHVGEKVAELVSDGHY